MICYLLPAVFYLKIRWHKKLNMRKVSQSVRGLSLRRLSDGGGYASREII